MDLKIKWMPKGGNPKTDYVPFQVEDILDRSRNHAIDLFSGNVPVVIRQGQSIISNDVATRAMYHRKPEYTVYALDKIARSEGKLSEVGFV